MGYLKSTGESPSQVNNPRQANMIIRSVIPDVYVPKDITFCEFLFRQMRKTPDDIAIVDGDTDTSYTFAEIEEMSIRFANALFANGFRKGDIMCVVSPNSPEYVVCYLGVCSIGGIVSTVNPAYTVREIRSQLMDSKPTYLMTIDSQINKMTEIEKSYGGFIMKITIDSPVPPTGYRSFRELLSEGRCELPVVYMQPEHDTALLLCSSGTTGLPKAAMLTHVNVITQIAAGSAEECSFLPAGGGRVSLMVFPMFHAAGIGIAVFHSLIKNCTLVVYRTFDFERFLQGIEKYKVYSVFMPPPIALRMVKDSLPEKYDLSSLNTVVIGAAPLAPSVQTELKHKFRIANVRGIYGMTEMTAATHISYKGDLTIGSVGKCYPNLECKIIDLEGATLDIGMTGQLCMRSAMVMKGYLNKKLETGAMVDSDGWLHTGDVGYFDKAGNLFIVDRLKELIKYKAYQVAPAELESLLLTHPDVADAAVIGIPDEAAGELPRAHIVLKPGHQASADDLHQFVKVNAAPYKQLRGGIIFRKEIPKSPVGKILRRMLRNELKSKI